MELRLEFVEDVVESRKCILLCSSWVGFDLLCEFFQVFCFFRVTKLLNYKFKFAFAKKKKVL